MSQYYLSLEQMVYQASIVEQDWNRFVERTRVKHVQQGTYLIETGEPVNHAYFCSEGLFRLFYTLADGREYNVGFSPADDYEGAYGYKPYVGRNSRLGAIYQEVNED
ncbi:hypothetical protein ABH894_004185 [Paenibacillus sp. RC62]